MGHFPHRHLLRTGLVSPRRSAPEPDRGSTNNPSRIAILITFFIYIRAGREIYKKHKQLKDFSTSHHDPEPLQPSEDLFSSTKTTEVSVTSEVIDRHGAIDLASLGERRRSQPTPPQRPPKAAYSVTISSNRRRSSHGDGLGPGPGPDVPLHASTTSDSQATTAAGTSSSSSGAPPLTRITTNPPKPHHNHTTTSATLTSSGGGANPNGLRRRAAYEANTATWSYTKCALLFFTAMLVTWIPSSANRVYSVVHAGQVSVPLEYMSSFVLPLQGFWNACIYFVTSWGAVRMLSEDVRGLWRGTGRGKGQGLRSGGLGLGGKGGGGGFGGLGGGGGQVHRSPFHSSKTYETESMTELAGSRPGSSGSPSVSSPVTATAQHRERKMEV